MLILLRKIARDFSKRRLRNILTLLGITLGVAGVVAIAATTQNMIDAQRLTYNNSNQADLAAFTGDLPLSSRDLITRQENIVRVDTRAVTFTRFNTGTDWENLRLVGIDDFSRMQLDIVDLSRGAFPSHGEIAFDESARELSPIEIGDIVAIQRSDADKPTYFTVSGFTHSPAVLGAGILNRAIAYATDADVRAITGRQADNFLLAKVVDRDRASQTASEITTLLEKRGTSVGEFEVRDPDEFIGSQELGTLLLLLRVFSILGAGLAAFLVANTVSAVISEETTQIGVIKSLGGRRWQIALTYLAYSAMLGALGGLIGLGLGEFAGRQLSSYLTALTGLQLPPLQIRSLEVLLAFGVGATVTIVAAVIPALVSAGKETAALLRVPGIRAEFRSALLQRITAPLARADTPLVAGLRNSMRRPARTALTVVVVAVAVAAFISTQALNSSVNGTVDDLYGLYGADGWIFFRGDVDLNYAVELDRNPFVLQAEPWTQASGAIGATRTDIWGMPVHNPLYKFRLTDGTWFSQTLPVSVVLTTNLASRIGASAGDRIQLDVGDKRQTVQIAGVVNDSSTYLGSTSTGKIFMPVADLQRLLGRGQQADLFALKFRSSVSKDVDRNLALLERNNAALAPGTLAAHADQESAQQAIGILTVLLRAMVIIIGVVGVVGIGNTLLINITERRREYGILRALGARTRHITTMLISEGIALAAVGLVVGIAIGYPLARYLVDLTGAELFELTFQLSIRTLALTMIVALLAVSAVSAIPGLIASRLRPVSVLRYE